MKWPGRVSVATSIGVGYRLQVSFMYIPVDTRQHNLSCTIYIKDTAQSKLHVS
jgi:hypothetical protein